MTTKKSSKTEIIIYTAIVILSSSLICYAAYIADDRNLSLLSVFMPSVLALVYTWFIKGKKGVYELFVKQTIQKVKIAWYAVAIAVIPLIGVLAVLTSLDFDISKFELRTTQLMPQMLVIVLIALGEEYGWRGFLLPRLMKKFNLFYSSLILGLIWGIWHFPAYLIGTGTPLDMPFSVFLVWVVMGTFFISWIYYYTRSVLTSILVHISANATFNYLLLLPEFTGSMNNFWLFLAYMSVIVVAVFLVKRRDFMGLSEPFVR
ncbi:CPBP family intramembrane glutamic endopeptidase [Flagellimonas sp.]|jgi:membrane protease YdiL (CAAX protease family)|uniref:CPBP family intramembrane glutamic endopeptidase n=1 Tax=Flagellimonas sp. TaxID=2058762 RepID=UPI003BAA1ADA